MERWAELARLGLTQFGVVAVWQAAELGIGRDTLARSVKQRGWTRVCHGVYLVAGVPMTPLAKLKAAELAMRRPLAFSHDSAGFLWELLPTLARPIHVVTGLDRKLCAAGVNVHRLTAFDLMAVAQRSSMPVLGPAETLCTLAAARTVGQLVALLGKADRKRLVTPKQVEAVAGRLGRFHGRTVLRKALERIGEEGLTHSGLERIARRLLLEAGLEPHGRPYTVVDEQGRFVAEIDIAFIAARVAVAIDGPHHAEQGQRRLDEDQRQALESMGWIVVRADELRLTKEPDRFVAQVRSALTRVRA